MNITNNLQKNDALEIESWFLNDFQHFLWTGNDFTVSDTHKKIEEHGNSSEVTQYLIRIEGKICAYAEVHLLDKESKWYRIVRLAVRQHNRNNGLANTLLDHIEKEILNNRGAKRLDLIVFTCNKAAIELYKKLQYRHEGTMRNCRVHDNKWYSLHIFSKIKE